MKRDVVNANLVDAYERVEQLPVLRYAYNDADYSAKECSFIAQEVKDIMHNAKRIIAD